MTNFVIVIEVDNKQALAAYARGLEDLDRVMPQLMDAAAVIDAEDDARYKNEWEKFNREKEAYKEKIKILSDNTFWSCLANAGSVRGLFYPEIPEFYRRHATHSLESIKAELVHMLNVARLATGPYRMTEHQVELMVSWGDGSRVESLKRNFCKPTTAGAEAGTMKGK